MGYEKFCIGTNVTIRDAMRKLDESTPKILFVTENDRLIAALTDGDIRRCLINGGTLDDLAVKAANHAPHTARDVQEAAAVYHSRNLIAIPIVSQDGRITDIYIGEPLTRKLPSLGLPVVINAGGKGTRLDPFTRVLPKPLIPVGEIPIIEHIMSQFKEYSCDSFHIIVNYKKQLIKAYFGECDRKYDVSWYDEEKPLGTGGGLSLLRGKLDNTFFFTGCDVLLKSDYESALRFHRENGDLITMICAYKNITIPYGVVEIGRNGVIERMREKPEISFLTNTGIYIVEPSVLDYIEDDVSVGFPDVVDKVRFSGGNVAVYPVSGSEWFDMGQLGELENMRRRLYGE